MYGYHQWENTGSPLTTEGLISGYLDDHPVRSDEGLTLETSAFQIFHGGNLTFINSFDKSKFLFNPVRETVVPITHDKLKSVNWSIYNGQIVQNSLKIIVLLQTLLNVILFDVCVLEYKGKKFRNQTSI